MRAIPLLRPYQELTLEYLLLLFKDEGFFQQDYDSNNPESGFPPGQ